MFFLYFISLFYFTQLVFSQIPSESETINKIISDILSKTEKKNALTESPEFPWNFDFTLTELRSTNKHYKTKKSSKKPKLDLNPFVRNAYQKGNPTLKLHELLPDLYKPHLQQESQTRKDGDRVAADSTQKTKVLKENQSSTKTYKNTKTTSPMKKVTELNEVTASSAITALTNFMIKIQRKPQPAMESLYKKLIPGGSHDDLFSESIFNTPQVTEPTENVKETTNIVNPMNQETTTNSQGLSFDTMDSTSPLSTMGWDEVKVFRYGSKTTAMNKFGSHVESYTPNVAITAKDWSSLKDVEDLIKSVPSYDKTSEAFEEFLKRVTEDSFKFYEDSITEKTFGDKNTVSKIDVIGYPTFSKEFEKIPTLDIEELSNFKTPTPVVHYTPFNSYKVSTPTFYPTPSHPSDLYLLIEPKDKSLKAVFALENMPSKNTGAFTTSSRTNILDKLSNYMTKTHATSTESEDNKMLDKLQAHITESLAPSTKRTHLSHTTGTVNKVQAFKNNSMMNKNKYVADSKSKVASKKSTTVEYGNSDDKKSSTDGTENSGVFTENVLASKKINVDDKQDNIYDKTNDIIDKESDTYRKESDTTDYKSDMVSNEDDIANKESYDKADISTEGNSDDHKSDTFGKDTDAISTKSDIGPTNDKKGEVADKKSNISDKKNNIPNHKSNAANHKSNVATHKSNVADHKSNVAEKTINIADKKSNIADEKSNIGVKKSNVADKKNNMADLYNDIVRMYGSLKEATEKSPERFHEKIAKHLNWESVKKFFGHDRVCNCKCKENKTMCKVCAASDAVMRELTFEFNNLADYMNTHCTEIQTFFWMNPSGGKKLRDTVHSLDKTMQDYYKRVRGKCTGRTCKTFTTYLDKKRNVDKKKRDKKFLIELLRDLEISDMK